MLFCRPLKRGTVWGEGGGRVNGENENEKSLTLSHCWAPWDPGLCKA